MSDDMQVTFMIKKFLIRPKIMLSHSESVIAEIETAHFRTLQFFKKHTLVAPGDYRNRGFKTSGKFTMNVVL